MKVTYHDKTRQCTVDDNGNLIRGLDSAARKYICYYCRGGIAIQKISTVWRLWCVRCGQLDDVASKHATRSSRVIAVNESAKKSKSDLFGGE